MKRFKLYTHDRWIKYAWESVNDAQTMAWDIRRCYYGDPYPHPESGETVFYADSELEHALEHRGVYKVALMLESRFITPGFYSYLERHIEHFDRVLTYDDELLAKFPDKCLFYPHGNCLVKRSEFRVYPKTRLVSFISSRKHYNVPGHAIRHSIYQFYKDPESYWRLALPKDFSLDMYGKLADRPVAEKLESLRDYMFQVVVENGIIDSYFTEKILDCFVSGTIPIYYGTRKVDDFFDPRGILHFSTLEDLLDILRNLDSKTYTERLEAVHRNFELAQQYTVAEDWIFENTDVMRKGESTNDRAYGIESTALPASGWLPPSAKQGVAAIPPLSRTLKNLARGNRQYLDFHTGVQDALIQRTAVRTRVKPPQNPRQDAPDVWYPPFKTAFLLQVPDGIIGDNVVFDEHAYYGFGHWWLGNNASLYSAASRVTSVESAISLAAWGGEAFQHFVLDVPARLGMVMEWLESTDMADTRIVSHLDRAPFAAWFWQKMGLLDRVLQKPLNAKEGKVIQTAMAYYPDWAPDTSEKPHFPRKSLGVHPRNALRPVQERLGLLEPADTDRVIYLRRGGIRSVGNEAELLGALESTLAGSGFRLQVFESSGDYERDMDMMQGARVVLGPHGGAFANLLFARPGTRVIEFVPALECYAEGHSQDRNYWGLAQAAGQDYWTVSPRNFDYDGGGMEVPTDTICRLVEAACDQAFGLFAGAEEAAPYA